MILIYGLKNCDSCRKARRALPGARFVDLRAEGVPAAVLARAHAAFGAALVNRRSATWRTLGAAERTRPPLALLAAHPALMKRPLIEADGRLLLGWNAQTRQSLGLA